MACDSGVATSEMVAARLRHLPAEKNVDVEIVAVDVAHVDEALAGADVFVPVVAPEAPTTFPP